MNSTIIYDIAGIGIGPFNLGLAALLHPVKELKTIFFEKNNSFNWHPGMMISGTTLQVPFYADLVTLADPCSRFSFFSFLKYKNRLIRFSIYDHHFISRKLFNEYCNWVASQLYNLQFNCEVNLVTYNQKKGFYEIQITNGNEQTKFYAKHIVCGIGTEPFVPPFCATLLGKAVFHSASYLYQKENLAQQNAVTVIGSGQSAAEIFFDLLQNVSGDSKKQLSWVTRSKGFSPMDYSKLALELTSPDYIKHFYHLPEHKKTEVLQSQSMLYKGINFSLIDRIYDRMYELAEDFGEIPARLLTNMELRNVTEKNGKYLLDFFHLHQEKHYRQSTDIVILATGYQNTFPDFFAPVEERICWKNNGDIDIAFNYSIDVNRSEIFVQNAELLTHGFNAPDLGMGPHRNAIIINSIMGYEYYQVEKNVAFQNFGV
ncbi:MAG TPA: SidA/IucD/PvdA family monooxygenase [Hanamia sp.]|nr:SidA/IucD/PvdA family monooxygenase [Hanamia sp.]